MMTESQLERYKKWQGIYQESPESIDRLPEPKKAQVMRALAQLEERNENERQQLAIDRNIQMVRHQKLAEREYIKHRSSVIAPPPNEAKGTFSSEKLVQCAIVVVSALLLGTGTANLARESGKEDWALVAGAFGGGLIGILAEATGKQMFVNRYMAHQYQIERDRLIAKKTALESKIHQLESGNS